MAYTAAIFVKLWPQLSEKCISIRGCVAVVLFYVVLLTDSGFAQKLKHAASNKLI